ncbi:MAG: hypothetical protein FJY85_22710, partial [Deltaproteobacteria bacterium]|nr:hypothetical protein [Deltaproteobacteria bacterium]
MKLPISIGSLLKGKGGAGGITQGFKDIQINIFREGYHVQARRLPGYALLGVLSVVALGSLFWIYQGYSDSNSDTTKLRSELDQIERKIKSMQSSTATNGTADVPMIDDEVKAEALKAAR